jgi:hypothetical protein
MNLDDRNKRLLLYVALLATVLAVIFAPPAQEPVQPSHSPSADTPEHNKKASGVNIYEHATAPASNFLPQKRSGLQNEPGELFMVDRPPPSTASNRPAPPPKPVAPPLPFTYMGKMEENGELTVFLTKGDVPYVAKVGDVLEGQYRVDSIHPPMIEFTYIPLGQKQTLNIGISNRAESAQPVPEESAKLPPEIQPGILEIQQRLKQMQNNGATK